MMASGGSAIKSVQKGEAILPAGTANFPSSVTVQIAPVDPSRSVVLKAQTLVENGANGDAGYVAGYSHIQIDLAADGQSITAKRSRSDRKVTFTWQVVEYA